MKDSKKTLIALFFTVIAIICIVLKYIFHTGDLISVFIPLIFFLTGNTFILITLNKRDAIKEKITKVNAFCVNKKVIGKDKNKTYYIYTFIYCYKNKEFKTTTNKITTEYNYDDCCEIYIYKNKPEFFYNNENKEQFTSVLLSGITMILLGILLFFIL